MRYPLVFGTTRCKGCSRKERLFFSTGSNFSLHSERDNFGSKSHKKYSETRFEKISSECIALKKATVVWTGSL